jgi:hypothetical protein
MLARLSLAVLAPLFALLLFTGSAEATCAAAGNCFWVGGTGTLDLATDSAHWSSTTNGGTCSCEPTSTSVLVFDASSNNSTAATVTVNVSGGTLTVAGITMGAFTGGSTLDFAANDNNVAIGNSGFSNNGSGTRTLNMGDGTWTITCTAQGNPWLQTGATNLTFNANASTLVFNLTQAGTGTLSFGGTGTPAYNIITVNSNSSLGNITVAGTFTVTTMNLVGPNFITFSAGVTYTITTLSLTGGSSLSALLSLASSAGGTATTLSIGNAATPAWCVFRDITKTGAGTITATNSIDLGHNTGFVSITPPATGGGSGGGIIGG